jgi:hypothetical protein
MADETPVRRSAFSVGHRFGREPPNLRRFSRPSTQISEVTRFCIGLFHSSGSNETILPVNETIFRLRRRTFETARSY